MGAESEPQFMTNREMARKTFDMVSDLVGDVSVIRTKQDQYIKQTEANTKDIQTFKDQSNKFSGAMWLLGIIGGVGGAGGIIVFVWQFFLNIHR